MIALILLKLELPLFGARTDYLRLSKPNLPEL
ncbi:MAG: hypothetical protein ACI854_001243 [Arenicella sp.]|jgi:hypothetical protein